MKTFNTSKKLILVSFSTALSFLMLMGINTAFSAPTQSPPETGLTPTFNGVTVGSPTDGIILNKDGLSRAGASPFILNSTTARKIQSAAGVVFEVLGNLVVDGTANLKNLELGSGLDPATLKIYGTGADGSQQLQLISRSKTGILSNLLMSVISGDARIVSDQNLNIVSTSATRTINFNGWPYDSTPATVQVNGDLTTTGLSKLLGDTNLGSTNTITSIAGRTFIESLESTPGQPISFKNPITVTGKIKATSFGTLTLRSVDLNATTLNQTISTPSVACSTNEVVVSCTFKSSALDRPWLVFGNRFLAEGCELVAKNQYNGTNSVRLTALCWNQSN